MKQFLTCETPIRLQRKLCSRMQVSHRIILNTGSSAGMKDSLGKARTIPSILHSFAILTEDRLLQAVLACDWRALSFKAFSSVSLRGLTSLALVPNATQSNRLRQHNQKHSSCTILRQRSSQKSRKDGISFSGLRTVSS